MKRAAAAESLKSETVWYTQARLRTLTSSTVALYY